MKSYAIHLDGIGSLNFTGVCYVSGSSTYWQKNEDGTYTLKYHSKNMEVDNLYIDDGQLTFSSTLIFQ